MDYMFSNCSSTAQRGALDWSKKFETLNKPLIKEIYESVKCQVLIYAKVNFFDFTKYFSAIF